MSCCVCVEQSEAVVIEDCGSFDRVAHAGCTPLFPFKTVVAGKVSLRLEELHVNVDSKSKDNVFVTCKVSVQYRIPKNVVDKAFYTLKNPNEQIIAYVHNAVRGQIPLFTIDEIYEMRGEISLKVKDEIDHAMDDYGFQIETVLFRDIEPASSVTDAMSKIQMYSRLKAATIDKAEGHKIQVIKAAEADAESKRLSGVGLAQQRKAIVDGLQSSIEHFQEDVQDLSSEDVMSLLLMNQYFDTLKDVAKSSSSSTLFLSHTGGLREVANTMNEGILAKKQK